MKYPVCSGIEYRLKDCNYLEGGDWHTQDWSITCNNGIRYTDKQNCIIIIIT